MSVGTGIVGHYHRGGLLARLEAALNEDGHDPARPSAQAMSPYDHLHGRGLEATEEVAAMLTVAPTDRLLDIGSGIGGPARTIAQRFGCRITGIDLVEEFCAVACEVSRRMAIDSLVDFRVGNALAMPFAAGIFNGAYTMNVTMNVPDKPALYREIRRVLKPGGWLVLSELAQRARQAPAYPTPWATTASDSFLSTQVETLSGLRDAGFEIEQVRDTSAEAIAHAARSREMQAAGMKPPQRAVQLILAERAALALRNVSSAVEDGRLAPIVVLCRRA